MPKIVDKKIKPQKVDLMKYSVMLAFFISSRGTNADQTLDPNVICARSESFIENPRLDIRADANKTEKQRHASISCSLKNAALDCHVLGRKIKTCMETNTKDDDNLLESSDANYSLVYRLLMSYGLCSDRFIKIPSKDEIQNLKWSLHETTERNKESGANHNRIKTEMLETGGNRHNKPHSMQKCSQKSPLRDARQRQFKKSFNKENYRKTSQDTDKECASKIFYLSDSSSDSDKECASKIFYLSDSSSDSDDQKLLNPTNSRGSIENKMFQNRDTMWVSECLRKDIGTISMLVDITVFNLKAYMSRSADAPYAVLNLIAILETFWCFLHGVPGNYEADTKAKHVQIHKLQLTLPRSFREVMKMLYGTSETRLIILRIEQLIEQILSVLND